ncbi:MAG: insulinase family protein [Chlorobi bacterium]|nr:insulinase family protein [Chlorobiota bacterium]
MKTKFFWAALAAIFLTVQCKSWKKQQETVRHTEETQTEQTAKPDKDYIPTDPAVRIGKLPNGMTYYIRRNEKPENKVEMRLALNAGSVLEDDDQQGLAHFMEHMNFNGLKHFPKNELVHFLQRMGVRFGADLNAYTSFDETVYMLPIPLDNPENLDKGLLVLHDWAAFANLDSAEIEKERGVVLEEYRLGLGAERRMWNKSLPVLLKDSRYAERLPIGKKEILETFPHEALKRYHRDWYRPDLEAVIIVGDIDPDQVEAKLKKMFDDIPVRENPRKREVYYVPNHKETLVSVADDPEASQNRVMVVYKAYDNYRKPETVDDYRVHLMNKLINKMVENRLEDLKESAEPAFTYAFARYGPFWARTKEAFYLTAITDTDKRMEALETLLTESRRIKEYGFLPEELERAKKDVLTEAEQAYNNRSTTHSRNYAWEYVRHYLQGEPIPGAEWEYQMHKYLLPGIGIDEVNARAKSYIHDDNRVILVHGKSGKDIRPVTEEEVLALVNKIDTASVKPLKKEEDVQTALMKEKPFPGQIVKKETDDVLGTVTYYLSNGAVVTAKRTDFKEDQTLFMGFKFGGKSLLDNETLKKTAHAFQGLPEAGVNGLKKKDLRKLLSGKRVKVNPVVDDYDADMYGRTRPKDLETAMQLNYLYYTALNKDPEAFESWRKRMIALYGNLLNSPQVKFIVALSDFMNQNNPRYTGYIPTPEILKQQDYDLAYAKFREMYDGATDFRYYIVGNYDSLRVEELIKTYIGGLPRSAYPGKYKDWGDYSLKGKHEFIYRAGKDPKSMVVIILGGNADYSPEEKLKLEILAKILNNKLIDILREEESGIYTVRAMSDMRKVPRGKYSFTVTFPCGPENARKLAGIAMDELQKLITEGPTEEELQKVTKSLLVTFDEQVKTNEFWLDYLSDTDYLDLDPHRFLRYKDFVSGLKPSDIRDTGRKYLRKPETEVLAIWYPEGFEEK